MQRVPFMKLSMCPLELVGQVGGLFYVFQTTYSVASYAQKGEYISAQGLSLVSGRAGVQIQADLSPGP